MAAPSVASYLLKRDRVEAIRLGSQHLLWQLHMKNLLHPDIPIKDGMAIADIGAGTGIWAVELAAQLSPSARVVAYDITDAHFPTPEYWASNVEFDHLDSLSVVPESLIEPGGFLQWEDARFGSSVVRGDAALQVRQMMDRMSSASKHNFQWLDELDQHVKRAEAGLDVVDCQYKPWSTQLIPLCMDTFLVALENGSAALDRLKQIAPSAPRSDEFMNALEALHQEMRKPDGSQLYWLPVMLLARKDD